MPKIDSGTIGTIISLISLLAAVVFFFLGKRKTLLEYHISTTPLVTEKMAVILNGRMSIDGQPVKHLSSTTIALINSGNQSISSSDFAIQAPLCVTLTGYLYGYDVSTGNQKLLPSLIQEDDKTVRIEFEGLKPQKYFNVTLLHDGHDKSLEITGELKTGDMRMYRTRKIPFYLFAGFIIAFIVTSLDYFIHGSIYQVLQSDIFLLIEALGIASIFFELLSLIYLKIERKMIRSRL